MKKTIVFLALIVLLGAGAFFALTKLDVDLPFSDLLSSSNDSRALTIAVNPDADAETVLYASGPEGEQVAAVQEVRNGQRYIKKVVMTSVEGINVVANLNNDGLVDRVDVDGATIIYSNHTDTTVDITVTTIDGSTN
jgi:hypothetical protein